MRSMEWLMERCKEDGDCLLWQGSTDNGNRPKLSVRDPAIQRARTLQPRRLIWEQTKGPVPAKRYVSNCCGHPLCLNPEHLVLKTRGQVVSEVAKRPDVKMRRHLGALHQRVGSDRDMELARYIRNSPKSGAALARETGIPPTTISAIRLNKRWKETVNPWAGLFAMNDSQRRAA